MDTRVLKYFLTVAQTNNITKAAEQLHITQPTLSRQIMDLETELDIKFPMILSHWIWKKLEGFISNSLRHMPSLNW